MAAGAAVRFVMGNIHPEAGRQARREVLQPGRRPGYTGALKLGSGMRTPKTGSVHLTAAVRTALTMGFIQEFRWGKCSCLKLKSSNKGLLAFKRL